MIINLKCEKCGHIYDWKTGKIDFTDEGSAVFENKSICPKCQAKDKDLLTEKGQSQLTTYWFDND